MNNINNQHTPEHVPEKFVAKKKANQQQIASIDEAKIIESECKWLFPIIPISKFSWKEAGYFDLFDHKFTNKQKIIAVSFFRWMDKCTSRLQQDITDKKYPQSDSKHTAADNYQAMDEYYQDVFGFASDWTKYNAEEDYSCIWKNVFGIKDDKTLFLIAMVLSYGKPQSIEQLMAYKHTSDQSYARLHGFKEVQWFAKLTKTRTYGIINVLNNLLLHDTYKNMAISKSYTKPEDLFPQNLSENLNSLAKSLGSPDYLNNSDQYFKFNVCTKAHTASEITIRNENHDDILALILILEADSLFRIRSTPTNLDINIMLPSIKMPDMKSNILVELNDLSEQTTNLSNYIAFIDHLCNTRAGVRRKTTYKIIFNDYDTQ